jgi:transcriptional regulator with XRE-family HTH domain
MRELDSLLLTSELIRAARALLRWDQEELARASGISLPTIKRLESIRGALAAHNSTVAALRRALESAGIEFIDGTAPGLRLWPTDKASSRERAGGPQRGTKSSD